MIHVLAVGGQGVSGRFSLIFQYTKMWFLLQVFLVCTNVIVCYATIHIGQPHKKGRRIWPHVLKLNHHKQLSERRPDPSCLTV